VDPKKQVKGKQNDIDKIRGAGGGKKVHKIIEKIKKQKGKSKSAIYGRNGKKSAPGQNLAGKLGKPSKKLARGKIQESSFNEVFSGDGDTRFENELSHSFIDLDATDALKKPDDQGSSHREKFGLEHSSNDIYEELAIIDHNTESPLTSSCQRGGVSYPVGWHFPAGDGCNLCYCQMNATITCTETPCGCYDSNGIFRESRESWSDPLDPCNVCTCRLVNYISDNDNDKNEKTKYSSQSKNTIEGGSYNDVKMGKNEVFCMRMTLVECYMRISARRQREQRFKHFLLKRGFYNSRYKIP